ncbi:MAG TPA: hypothetical protein VMW42_12255 [Desulfatiglandales bacterium]|nr:hypothetical protein [Desulfatiglandales bacterium]
MFFRNLSIGKPQVSVSRYEYGYGCLFFETEEELAYILAKVANEVPPAAILE